MTDLSRWLEHDALCPAFTEPKRECTCGLAEALSTNRMFDTCATHGVADCAACYREHGPADPNVLGTINHGTEGCPHCGAPPGFYHNEGCVLETGASGGAERKSCNRCLCGEIDGENPNCPVHGWEWAASHDAPHPTGRRPRSPSPTPTTSDSARAQNQGHFRVIPWHDDRTVIFSGRGDAERFFCEIAEGGAETNRKATHIAAALNLMHALDAGEIELSSPADDSGVGLLVEFFRDEAVSMGRAGDCEGWSPAEMAVYYLRQFAEERDEWTIERAVGQRQLEEWQEAFRAECDEHRKTAAKHRDAIERIYALRAVVAKCAERYREYERLHLLKVRAGAEHLSIQTDAEREALRKAASNRAMAEMCEAAIGGEAVRFKRAVVAGDCPPGWFEDVPGQNETDPAVGIGPEARQKPATAPSGGNLGQGEPETSAAAGGPEIASELPAGTGTDDATRAREARAANPVDAFVDYAFASGFAHLLDPSKLAEARRLCAQDTFVDLGAPLAEGPFTAAAGYVQGDKAPVAVCGELYGGDGHVVCTVTPDQSAGGTVGDAVRECQRIADALNAVDEMTCPYCHDLGNAHAPDCPEAPSLVDARPMLEGLERALEAVKKLERVMTAARPARKPWIKPEVRKCPEPLDKPLLRESFAGTGDTASASARLEQRLTERAGALGMAGLRGLTVQASGLEGGVFTINLGDVAEAIIAEVRRRQAQRSW